MCMGVLKQSYARCCTCLCMHRALSAEHLPACASRRFQLAFFSTSKVQFNAFYAFSYVIDAIEVVSHVQRLRWNRSIREPHRGELSRIDAVRH
eukprot:5531166-Pleurochrysis_carterae.AAC.2